MNDELTNEQMVQIYQLGNKSALDKLLERNQGIIRYVLKRFYYNENDYDDLLQVGMMGIMAAAKKFKFNLEYSCKFSTYMAFYIDGYIRRYLNKSKRTRQVMSLDEPMGDGIYLIDYLASGQKLEDDVIEKVYQLELKQDLYNSMKKANTLLEKEILEFSYGLCCTIPLNDVEVGKILSITPGRVLQEKRRGLRKLRRSACKLPIGRYKNEEEEIQRETKYSSVDSLLYNIDNIDNRNKIDDLIKGIGGM